MSVLEIEITKFLISMYHQTTFEFIFLKCKEFNTSSIHHLILLSYFENSIQNDPFLIGLKN